MHPILLHFGNFSIYSYGFCVAVAMLLSLYITQKRAAAYGVDQTTAADVLFAVFIFGIFGARVMYIVQNWDDYSGDLWAMFRLQEGGLVWYGGLFAAIFFGVLYALSRRWPILKLCDFFAPVAALAHGIGRIGCFFNGCCYGRRTDSWFGVHFPGDTYAKLPTQLYEALGLFMIAAFLFFYARKRRPEGSVVAMYLVLYAALRFVVEFFRGDNPHYFFLTPAQWISAGLIFASLALWAARRRNT